jgi:non-heme chloroperoxidase
MTYITTKDGTRIFYKDWGTREAQPIVFHHGWPLSADDWDNQMMFFLAEGYRVIAHDRRGHGRSDQTDGGNEMDTYAADIAELVTTLNLKNAIHIGHSTGGGEVTRYVARAEPGRVAKAVLVDAVPPVMVKNSGRNANRGLRRIPCCACRQPRPILPRYSERPFLRLQPAGRESVRGSDLKAIDVPVLVIHSEDDQIVPYADSAPLTVKLLKNGTLKTYKDLPHGLFQTHPEIVNPEVPSFAGRK